MGKSWTAEETTELIRNADRNMIIALSDVLDVDDDSPEYIADRIWRCYCNQWEYRVKKDVTLRDMALEMARLLKIDVETESGFSDLMLKIQTKLLADVIDCLTEDELSEILAAFGLKYYNLKMNINGCLGMVMAAIFQGIIFKSFMRTAPVIIHIIHRVPSFAMGQVAPRLAIRFFNPLLGIPMIICSIAYVINIIGSRRFKKVAPTLLILSAIIQGD